MFLRLGEEEDAIKGKVDELYRGGDQIVQTLTDSWNEGLAHEHRNITHKLEEEMKVLGEASELIKAQDTDSWRNVISRGDGKMRVEKSGDNLTARIEALRRKQKGI